LKEGDAEKKIAAPPLIFWNIVLPFWSTSRMFVYFLCCLSQPYQVGNTGKSNNGILEATSFKGWFNLNYPFSFKKGTN
jgi:hypothetical protein